MPEMLFCTSVKTSAVDCKENIIRAAYPASSLSQNRWSISSSENESEAEYLPCGVSGRASLDSFGLKQINNNLLALCEIWV